MKYGVLLRVHIPENNWITLGENHIIPWDNRDLIGASSGWDIMNEENMGLASALVPKLKKGIYELVHHTDSYSTFEIAHGVGTTRETLEFYQELLKDCQEHPFTELYGCIVN
jgi:phosphoribosyl 1,2-cyclic phosphodiesterase